jgi:Skp family chaperone for outer membrane proteins
VIALLLALFSVASALAAYFAARAAVVNAVKQVEDLCRVTLNEADKICSTKTPVDEQIAQLSKELATIKAAMSFKTLK